MKRTYLYFTIVRHPEYGRLIYVGSKTIGKYDPVDEDGQALGYYGSAPMVLGHPEWCQTRILRWLEHESGQYTNAESELIRKCWLKYGAFYKGTCYTNKDGKQDRRSWLDNYKKGICINCHCGRADQFENHWHDQSWYTSEMRTESAKKRWESGAYDTADFKDRSSCNYSQLCKNFKDGVGHMKGVQHRKDTDSYKRGAIKVAETIKGKPHFISCKIQAQYKDAILEFNSIKEAEIYFESIGVHITRATISQGLKRCNGTYVYKDMITFMYNSDSHDI